MKTHYCILLAKLTAGLALGLGSITWTFAADAAAQNTELQVLRTADATTITEATTEEQFKKWGFAAGVGAVFMGGGREVENASADSAGVVRADFKSKTRLGVIMEGHYLFPRKAKSQQNAAKVTRALSQNLPADVSDFAPGLMVGAEVSENTIRSLGLGLILSWRRFEADKAKGGLTQKVAFNIGAMYLVESNVKMLADGFRDGSTLPSGQTAIRFKQDSRSGFALLFSAGF